MLAISDKNTDEEWALKGYKVKEDYEGCKFEKWGN